LREIPGISPREAALNEVLFVCLLPDLRVWVRDEREVSRMSKRKTSLLWLGGGGRDAHGNAHEEVHEYTQEPMW